MKNASRLGRMPIWAFALTCIVASGIGLIVFAVLGAAISDLAGTSTSIIVVLALVGLLGPAAWLVSIRRRQNKPQSPASLDAPNSQNSESAIKAGPRLLSNKAVIGISLGVAVVVILFLLPGRDPLGLKLTLEGEGGFMKGITIINTKASPIAILKASINGRDDCSRTPLTPPPELKEGDQTFLLTGCEVMRVIVTTNRGTATYTFK